MVASERTLAEQAAKQTFQKLPEATGASRFRSYAFTRQELLPIWGSRFREIVLRGWERHPRNSLVQGAIRNAVIRVLATQWEIKGPPNDPSGGVEHWQEFLRDMAFGQGWGIGLGAFLRDFFRQDIGAFMEVIGPGAPDKAMTGEPSGLAVLDALRCTPTGDPEYPVIYVTRNGQRHIVHKTRVFRLLDMPDSDETRPGPIGLCGMSRLAAVIQREVLMGRYVEAFLDDKPKPGILLGRNFSEESWNTAVSRYRDSMRRDDMDEWGKTMFISGLAVDQAIELTPISFSEAPEKFDFQTYTVQIDVPTIALCLGVDPQDIWPLSGQRMGTGTQSEILHAKGTGNTFGFLLQQLERELNDTLPEDYEFQFKYRDAQQDKERAEMAQLWAGFTQTTAVLTDDEKRQLLANMVEPVKDVITDDMGQVIRLDDADPKEDPEEGLVPPMDEEDEGEQMPPTGGAEPDEAMADDTEGGNKSMLRNKAWAGLKGFDSTRTQFVILLQNAIETAQSGTGSPRVFRIQLREMLRTFGRTAYQDGLEDGGVNRADMDERDENALRQFLVEQSGYVDNFAASVYAGTMSERAARVHAEMWANKSLRGAYNLGKASAAWNVPHQWQLGMTEEHCTDCLRLNGQVHRMRDYRTRGWIPGSDKLECGGFHCDCRLMPVPGERARGRF